MSLKANMENVLNDFPDIVESYQVLKVNEREERSVFYVKVNLINTDLLFSKDVIVKMPKHAGQRKYAYQWMDANNQLIIRWDNAEHHPDLKNAPFHKHLKADENVVPAPETTLREVLEIIRFYIKNC